MIPWGVAIACRQTEAGREIELTCGHYSLIRTDRGTVQLSEDRPLDPKKVPLKQYSMMLEHAAALDFEETWASHFEGVPYAPSDRAEA